MPRRKETGKVDSHPRPRRTKVVAAPSQPVETPLVETPLPVAPKLTPVGNVMSLGNLVPEDYFTVGGKFFKVRSMGQYGVEVNQVRSEPGGLAYVEKVMMGYPTLVQRVALS